jgi:glycosyltransferase involved in cell wall biosynthesis
VKVSVVVPILNEEGSLPNLFTRLTTALDSAELDFEVLLIDDGSTDDSPAIIAAQAQSDPRYRSVRFVRNFGQTAALSAGFDLAQGDVIVTIDADLQNDPNDIPHLLEVLDAGHDVVSGWRRDRQDARFRRNLVSRLANRLISRVSGVPLHDYGCTLKAYRADMVKDLGLYGEMHRFIPIYASWSGARITEVPVQHHPSTTGESKYGLGRTYKVVLDLLVVRFLDRYLTRPIHVFGAVGLLAIGLSIAGLVTMVALKLFADKPMISTPLPMLTAVVGLVGVLSILLGLLAELTVRTYFSSLGKASYKIRQTR